MENATQFYVPNVPFQISSVNQLTSFDKTEYNWEGRTLTSWTDDKGNEVELDKTDFKSLNLTSYLSGHWSLNKHGVSAFIPSGHGKVIVTSNNAESPLSSIYILAVWR